ncbi:MULTISPECIES: hypothetical protein [unclassified Pseudomonas]|uniref:hypothetical protein n=1 Tax=unclassified Pseudomonas TaxID=196821 RepID=UPI002AC8D003|nr:MULTISPECIES: hypothetical protein [unclassified Pseudomonas]MEB0045270.1 hypothetical protein [Pseudomonas sp. Dout3]MEB0096374.1 hypothetical protein [Pseudomonas sp. DC1.2]WPX61332.1 hypothetical protein RHM68_12060 [Pseudomonas sp. DC1.2]
MNIIVKTLSFAPGEHFRTSSSSIEFPEFIATSAFFITNDAIHLTQLTAVERPVLLTRQGVTIAVREIAISLPDSLASATYPVGGESDVSFSMNVDGAISEAISGTVTLDPPLDGKLGGSFNVTVDINGRGDKNGIIKGDFKLKLPIR